MSCLCGEGFTCDVHAAFIDKMLDRTAKEVADDMICNTDWPQSSLTSLAVAKLGGKVEAKRPKAKLSGNRHERRKAASRKQTIDRS